MIISVIYMILSVAIYIYSYRYYLWAPPIIALEPAFISPHSSISILFYLSTVHCVAMVIYIPISNGRLILCLSSMFYL